MSRNIQILSDWVDGKNFRPTSINFQTGSAVVAQDKEATPIGEIWSDPDGKDWKRIGPTTWSRVNTILDVLNDTNPTCCGCYKIIDYKNRYDSTSYSRDGKLCFDCRIERDDKRKFNGTFKLYEQQIVFRNQRDWVTDTLGQLKEGIENIDTNLEVINEHGGIERWSGMDADKLESQMINDIAEGEQALIDIERALVEVDCQIIELENGNAS